MKTDSLSRAEIADRCLSMFEVISGELINAIARTNELADRLHTRNDRLFGTGPEGGNDPHPVPSPDGAIPTAMLLLSDLNFAIDRVNAQVDRQHVLV
ncbi:hypothetical protein [Sphingobium yanoikuyae]|uniref:hypothetical protein n=1 Tax=Sphingobium yanoikuyae TaxID=13690 RepID=UPI002FDE0C3B